MNLFLIQVWGDVDPISYGPFKDDDERLKKARALHQEDEGCIFAVDVTVNEAGEVTIEPTPFTDEELGDPDEYCDSCGASHDDPDSHTEECEYAESRGLHSALKTTGTYTNAHPHVERIADSIGGRVSGMTIADRIRAYVREMQVNGPSDEVDEGLLTAANDLDAKARLLNSMTNRYVHTGDQEVFYTFSETLGAAPDNSTQTQQIDSGTYLGADKE